MTDTSVRPFVSVLLAVRNESRAIRKTLETLFHQDYPQDRLEVIVADGMSDDGTRDILKELQKQYASLYVIDNHKKIVSAGLNMAFAQSKGDVIVRVDGHTEIAMNYISQCISTLERTDADNVGGPMNAYGATPLGEAIALATSTPFGVGSSRFHYSDQEEWVDTVYMGAWKRKVFERMGLFDEELVRNQDDEWNYRLKEMGGRIYLDPNIKSKYQVRSTLKALSSQYFQYGYWKVRVMQKHPRQMRLSHYIPAIFIFTLLFSIIEHGIIPALKYIFFAVLGAYALVNLSMSVYAASRKDKALLPYLPLVYGTLHMSYGFGFLLGMLRFFHFWLNPKYQTVPFPQEMAQESSWTDASAPFVSVIMPIRNEGRYISRSLEAVLAQDYPLHRYEIIIVDGQSTDGTVLRVQEYMKKYPHIRIIDNPKRIVSSALNIGLRESKGEIIVRVDGHCEIPPNYISQCVHHIVNDKVDGVGGPIDNIGETFIADAIALAMSSWFGVGGAPFRTIKDRIIMVDTIAYPAYTRAIVKRGGDFDETLIRNQDDEYNFRLRKLGAKLMLSHQVKSKYYSRGSLVRLCSQYFQYGFWKPYVVLFKHPQKLRWRHLIPSFFVALFAGALFPGEHTLKTLCQFVIMAYVPLNLVASFYLGFPKGWRYALVLPLVYITLHLSYGAGFFLGLLRFVVPGFGRNRQK